ncbi:MoaD/ThiS family protein [Anaerolineales bacterium HSG6]|nr:MoaD/ThiS family protein [Anaerolineales bacterium HSG6]MDM8530652.1 MoaD/ThiS family protein [Anaerolineales bacterium HSG25]
MKIKIYATLRDVAGSKSVHLDTASEITVGQMLKELSIKYPNLHAKLHNPATGELYTAIQILINGRDMRYIKGMETIMTIEDDIRMFPPIGGGL